MPTRARRLLSVLALSAVAAAAACGPAGSSPPPPSGEEDGGTLDPDGGSTLPDGAPIPGPDGGEAEGLPFPFDRPPAGTPVSPAELTAITDTYLDLLAKTRYFDVLDERVHGWPQSDPQKRFWYGTWWTGAGFEKTGGKVSLVHVNIGADNNGIGTSFVLEGTCLAHRMWKTPKLEQLVRRLARGFHSYILAMERSPNDPAGVLMARTVYPPSVTSLDGNRSIFIDYSADRPGIDSYTQYVRIQTNPQWGDTWIKNKRSKDDIGHMLRAIATLEDCSGGFAPDTQADVAAMRAAYVKWATRVENEAWSIATYDKNGQPWTPPITETMSHFITAGNAECDAVAAMRLFSKGSPGAFDCGNGIHPLEALALTNEHNGEIIRSFHEAATRHALSAKQYPMAKNLLGGLVKRVEDGVAAAEANKLPKHLSAELLVKLVVHSAETGVPLTSREVRWVHGQIAKAHASYVAGAPDPRVYRVFDQGTPDGAYAFTPEGDGIDFRFFAALAGTCTAKWRNPKGQPLLDCARLATFVP